MGLIAYKLRDDYAEVYGGEYGGGLVHVGTEGREADIAALLEDGGGTIVLDDGEPAFVIALDEYPALQRTAVPDGASAINPVAGPYEGLKVGELRAELERRDLATSGNRGELIERLEAADAEPEETTDGDDAGTTGEGA